jgi:hypothetical protein
MEASGSWKLNSVMIYGRECLPGGPA